MEAMGAALTSNTLSIHGQTFQPYSHPVVAAGARLYNSGRQEGRLRFFKAVLPYCNRMIDCGANLGFATPFAKVAGSRSPPSSQMA